MTDKQYNGPPVEAYAVPVAPPPMYPPQNHYPSGIYPPQGQYPQQGNYPPPMYPGPGPMVVQGYGGYQDFGTCRICGIQFVRPPGTNVSSAQYHRCPRCAEPQLCDFCVVS